MKNAALLFASVGLGIILTNCGDPKPPPQTKAIPPDVMAQQINTVDEVQKQNEAAAYQYYQQQQAQQASANRPVRR